MSRVTTKKKVKAKQIVRLMEHCGEEVAAYGLSFRFGVQGSGFRVQGSRFTIHGAECSVQGLNWGSGFRVESSRLRVLK